MTLVIALKCTNGIVMASDGQATVFSTGGPVRQRIKKIFKLAENILFGASGSVGAIQRVRDIFRQYATAISQEGLYYENTVRIRREIFELMKGELDRHQAFHGRREGAPLADILVCVCELPQGKFRIWHITADCSEEFLDEVGYGCSGIGDTFAHTLLRNYYSEDLDIDAGKVIAYRVIKDAIDVGAFGLGEPIDIWVMRLKREKEGKYVVRTHQLSSEEIMALRETYVSWKNAERELLFKKILRNRKSK